MLLASKQLVKCFTTVRCVAKLGEEEDEISSARNELPVWTGER